MSKHTGFVRAFHWTSKAWYARKNQREVIFGMFRKEEPTTTGEISMTWQELGSGLIVPKLSAFDDSWSALCRCVDVLNRIADVDDQNMTEQDFVNILLNCGFKDFTEYDNLTGNGG